MPEPEKPTQEIATEREDPFALARSTSVDELTKLHLAEQFFEARHQRRKRSTRIAIASQALVGYVAFAGLLVNAYQSYTNAQKQQRQQEQDTQRWAKEFERAKESDKYRAFFETSVLATDPTNADKRLVGYALLQEFVQDKEYNSKATLMLEESLLQELRGDTQASGLDDAHRNAVVAILTALSQTPDCHALDQPSRSIGKIARRHIETHDLEETTEVFGTYVRRIVGRAAEICPTMKDFRAVRAPIRETLMKLPEIGGLKGKITAAQANQRIAEILRDRCNKELSVSGGSECADIYGRYVRLCTAETKETAGKSKDAKEAAKEAKETVRDNKDETGACDEMKGASTEATAQAAANPPPAPLPNEEQAHP